MNNEFELKKVKGELNHALFSLKFHKEQNEHLRRCVDALTEIVRNYKDKELVKTGSKLKSEQIAHARTIASEAEDNQRNKSLNEYNEHLKNSLSEKDKEIKRLENEMASVRNAHVSVLDRHSDLFSELCKEKSKSKTLTKEIKDHDRELNEVKKERNNLEKERNDLHRELNTVRYTLNECKTELNELRRKSERDLVLQSFGVLLDVQDIINQHIEGVYSNKK